MSISDYPITRACCTISRFARLRAVLLHQLSPSSESVFHARPFSAREFLSTLLLSLDGLSWERGTARSPAFCLRSWRLIVFAGLRLSYVNSASLADETNRQPGALALLDFIESPNTVNIQILLTGLHTFIIVLVGRI